MNKFTYTEVQDKVLKEYPQGLYLSGYVHNPGLSLEQFLRAVLVGLACLNTLHDTYEGSSNTRQCGSGKRRSLGDIFLICRSYYPDCPIKEIHALLYQLREKEQIFSRYCGDVSKRVWRWYSPGVRISYGKTELSDNRTCEYGWKYNEIPAD